MVDQGILVSKKEKIISQEKPINTCYVKNCGKEIPEGEEMVIKGNIYCASCGAIIIKSALGL